MPPAVHVSPGGQLPRQVGNTPPHGSSVVVVVLLVVVVLVVVVLVVIAVVVVVLVGVVLVVVELATVDVVVVQVRQQLPLRAVPPAAAHRIADFEFRIRHVSPPPDDAIAHAIRPDLPHVDRVAQSTTTHLHSAGSTFAITSAAAARETHRT